MPPLLKRGGGLENFDSETKGGGLEKIFKGGLYKRGTSFKGGGGGWESHCKFFMTKVNVKNIGVIGIHSVY